MIAVTCVMALAGRLPSVATDMRRNGRCGGATMTPDLNRLLERGWIVTDLPDPSIVRSVRDRLLERLRALLEIDLACLEDYHTVVGDDVRHIDVLYDLAHTFWHEDHGIEIVQRNLPLVQPLVGVDLHVQSYPYLRITRPFRPRDCVGLHRDTHYGASAYELALLIPLTDITPASGLRVLSGSHVEPESAYPFRQQPNAGFEVGSKRHQLGFPYAPRTLDPALDARAEPVAVAVGQALVFSLSLVHGAVENESGRTRVSTDVRVANSFAPVAWGRGVRADYYRPLCSGPVAQLARQYLDRNDPDRRDVQPK
jgi:hypothetical protein